MIVHTNTYDLPPGTVVRLRGHIYMAVDTPQGPVDTPQGPVGGYAPAQATTSITDSSQPS